jgi:hypothetical protein
MSTEVANADKDVADGAASPSTVQTSSTESRQRPTSNFSAAAVADEDFVLRHLDRPCHKDIYHAVAVSCSDNAVSVAQTLSKT